ncbi:MAG: translation initiation factor IF-6 [Thermoplasmata archaeon]|nr:MAG: translation initiation factor IF-6 [Thermoplasmata archaeon]
MLKTLEIRGSGYVGVYCCASDKFCVVPPILHESEIEIISKSLSTEIIETTIAGTVINGTLCAINSTSAIVTNFIEDDEIKSFGDINVIVLEDRHNTAGNNILMNDRAVYINPEIGNDTIKMIEKELGLDVQKGTIAGLKNVGSAAIITNRGILCHPHVREDEKKTLEDLFNLKVYIGTVNYGSSLVGACAIANSRGAIVGSRTTGIEMHRIEEALNLI